MMNKPLTLKRNRYIINITRCGPAPYMRGGHINYSIYKVWTVPYMHGSHFIFTYIRSYYNHFLVIWHDFVR